MLGLLAKAAQAAWKAARSPAVRKAAVDAAKAVASKARAVGRGVVQGCKIWQRNRAIRLAYNARKRVLAKEIQAMRASGASREAIARRASEFRKAERLRARQEMIKNGDGDLVRKLQQRDLKKYGDPDGPTFDHMKGKAGDEIAKRMGRPATEAEIYESIAESATRTDWVTNLKFLAF